MATKSFAIAQYTPPDPMPDVIGLKESIMYLRWRGLGQSYNNAVKAIEKNCVAMTTSFARSKLYTSASVIAYADKLEAEQAARRAKENKSAKAKDVYQPIDLEQQFKVLQERLNQQMCLATRNRDDIIELVSNVSNSLVSKIVVVEAKLDRLIEMWESKPPTDSNA